LPPAVDVALLSASPTLGWRMADDAFAALVRDAGASCAVVRVSVGPAGRLRRHPALTDLVESLASRHSASRLPPARAVVVSTVTASFFQRLSVPYAVRFDAPAALNRPGWPGAWQRWIEPRALSRADVLLPWSEEAAVPGRRVIPLGVPIERVAGAEVRDVAALAYAGNPHKRGLEVLASAWASAGLDGRLVVGGISAAAGRAWLARHGVPDPGIEWVGVIPRAEWLALLGRARLYVNASRFEDHGIAPLEALSAGAALVSLPTPGPYPALRMARELAPELVSTDLAAALRAGAGVDLADYARRADALLVPHRVEAMRRTVAEEVLPALGISQPR
jgi:glycosyltransferase involved in cell wall biosynthesis